MDKIDAFINFCDKSSLNTDDTYMITDVCVKRLIDEYVKYGKLIIAYDFDETVNEHRVGYCRCQNVIELLKQCKKSDINFEFIVFTCRNEKEYPEVKKYLDERNIPYDFINENNSDLAFKPSRKIFYNIFFDDRCGLKSAYDTLKETLKYLTNQKRKED